jgi:hypothetical protein
MDGESDAAVERIREALTTGSFTSATGTDSNRPPNLTRNLTSCPAYRGCERLLFYPALL